MKRSTLLPCLRYGAAFIFMFNSFLVEAKVEIKKNQIVNFFYHRGQLCDRLVCYFDSAPTLQEHASKEKIENDSKETVRLFLPSTECSDVKIMDALQKLCPDCKQNVPYSVSFQSVESPKRGMQVLITYNPRDVAYQYESFEAIKGQRAVAFNFYFKQTLEHIKTKTDGLMRYTSARPYSVMIDAGHGGSDRGAIGHTGIEEKIVVKQVTDKVSKILRDKGYRVFQTRACDEDVSIDRRTTCSNFTDVDVVLSIHANSSSSADAHGIETYYTPYSLVTRPKKENVGDTHKKILSYFETARDRSSELLASCVHKELIKHAMQHAPVIDRKVKKSVAQLLFGTERPAALVEIGFVSHKQECERLADPFYQNILAQGMCKGIEMYFEEHSRTTPSHLISFFLPQALFLC